MERVALTPEGKELLLKEISYRENDLRERIIKDIAEARAHGDISENSEFEDAKERQALNEGIIQNLKGQLGASIVIDVTEREPPEGVDRTIIFGCTVLLEDEEGNELQYKLVGLHQASPKSGRLYYKSPIGQALIGKLEGEGVEVTTPNGLRSFDILEVHYK